MAKSVNKVTLLGNVGKDPEVKVTGGGMTVASFSIATTDRIKGKDGQWTDKTEWHSLVAFARTAEIVRDYVQKGSKIYIDGKLQTRSWDDKSTGEKKYKTEIFVNDIALLGGRVKEERSGSPGGYSRGQSSSGYGRQDYGGDTDFGHNIPDEEIPF